MEKSRPKIKLTHGPVKVFYDEDVPATCERKPSTEAKETQTDDSLLEELIQERLSQKKMGHSSIEEDPEDEAYRLMVKGTVSLFNAKGLLLYFKKSASCVKCH